MEKHLLVLLVSNIPSIVALSGAIYLASMGKDGWGWLIFTAIVLAKFLEFNPKL